MKIEIEIDEALVSEAHDLAKRQGVTIRELVERRLKRVLAESRHAQAYKLRRASFKGNGLQAAVREATWEDLRSLSYDTRGTKPQPR